MMQVQNLSLDVQYMRCSVTDNFIYKQKYCLICPVLSYGTSQPFKLQ